MSKSSSKATRSERQAGKRSVSVPEQRARILAALERAEHGLRMSAMAFVAFPEFTFRTKQGAALAVCRTVSSLHDDRLIRCVSSGYGITQAGKNYIAASRIENEVQQ